MESTPGLKLHLRAWRKKMGLTQEQLGNILDLGKPAISRWENSQRQMDLEDLDKIARAFNIEPIALFLSPEDYLKAKAISDFAKLIDEIGLERAVALMTAVRPPETKLP